MIHEKLSDRFIGVRVPLEVYRMAEHLLKAYPNTYSNLSSVVRVALIREYKRKTGEPRILDMSVGGPVFSPFTGAPDHPEL